MRQIAITLSLWCLPLMADQTVMLRFTNVTPETESQYGIWVREPVYAARGGVGEFHIDFSKQAAKLPIESVVFAVMNNPGTTNETCIARIPVFFEKEGPSGCCRFSLQVDMARDSSITLQYGSMLNKATLLHIDLASYVSARPYHRLIESLERQFIEEEQQVSRIMRCIDSHAWSDARSALEQLRQKARTQNQQTAVENLLVRIRKAEQPEGDSTRQ